MIDSKHNVLVVLVFHLFHEYSNVNLWKQNTFSKNIYNKKNLKLKI